MSNLPFDVTDDIITETTVVLANAGEKMVEGMFDGESYRIEPGGEVSVRNVYKYPVKASGHLNTSAGKQLTCTASDVAKHLLREGLFWDRGVYIKTGDKAKDESKAADAAKRWLKWRYSQAQRMQTRWLETCDNAKREGVLPPSPPQDINEAIDFLRKHKDEILRDGRKRFVCDIDGTQTDSEEEMVKYIYSNYKDRVGKSDVSSFFVDLENPYAVRKSEAVTLVALPNVGSELYEKAEKAGINLTKPLMSGLLKNDHDSIEKVQSMLEGKQAP